MPVLYEGTDDRYDCFGILNDPDSGDCQVCSVFKQCRRIYLALIQTKRFTRISAKRLKAAGNPQYKDICGIPAAHLKKLADLRNLVIVWGHSWSTFYYRNTAILASNGFSWYACWPKVNYDKGKRKTLHIRDIKELDEHVRYYVKEVQAHGATLSENRMGDPRERLRRRRKSRPPSVG